ncbi:hypothetical protein [Zobellia galactanivorans]|uniref:hypothetical protein n=1 Tax=Zobellia galactanivorans (strain DSM 12802 / CCUG 47099 / CIP 106680 / NCIMB 13871 / Dsij) TaxID=63186 RepID=UPI001C06A2FB|nr:hypothetical protein [Zobellia galactanivorans]MBU3028102.1 hypothetical protein [Zobellia galactanivorans]
MKNLFLLLTTVLVLGTPSVSAQNDAAEPTKMEEVMESHDRVMDKMPMVSKLISKLQTKANASYEKTKYENAIADLKNANKSMMTWMENFGKRFTADEMFKGKKLSAQKKKWLLEEEKKVALLDEEIDLSIAQAKTTLGIE